MPESRHGFRHIGRVQLNADESPAETLGHEAHRARPEEWVEDELVRGGRGEQTGLDQRLGEGRDVRTPGIGGVDVPNAPSIAFTAVLSPLLHRFVIVTVLLRLREHKKVFVGAGGPVADTLRHGVRFVPNNVAAQEPSVVLQRQRQPPRHPKQVFVFEPWRVVRPHIHRAVGVLLIRRAPAAIPAGVSIADIQPEDPVRLEHALYFGKHDGERLDEPRQRWLQPDLPGNPIIP
jgi:hypothetical protein